MKLSRAWCLYVEACEVVFKAYKVKLVFVNTQDYIVLCSMDQNTHHKQCFVVLYLAFT